MATDPQAKPRKRFRHRQKSPEYCNICVTKTAKAKLKEIAHNLDMSIAGLIHYWAENQPYPALITKELREQYPSPATSYKKSWKTLCDFVKEKVLHKPGQPLEFYTANRANFSEKQVSAALDWLVREGVITRTVAGFFPVTADVPG